MKKLYFGRYVHRNSFLHTAHPMIKFLAMLAVILKVGVSGSFFELFFSIAGFVVSLRLSRLSYGEVWQVVKPFRFLLIFTVVLQSLFDASLQFRFPPDSMMLSAAVLFTTRFLLMILFSALFTLTTSPVEIVRVFYTLARPLGRFGVNVREIAVSMLVALRFIPLLFEEADKILTARKLRGEWPEKGSWRVVLQVNAFIVPLFMRVLHYSEQIAITLRFRNDVERVMQLPTLKRGDALLSLGAVLFVVGIYVI